MKKLALLCIITFSTLTASAQCTPDPNETSPGIYPDSATGFSDACVGVLYNQLITNVVPADTNIVVFGMTIPTTIDSIVIDSLNGLPLGLSMECNPAGCVFIGGETGCALISGTPTEVGNYQLIFYLSAYVGGVSSPNPYTVDYYSINVNDCVNGIKEEEVAIVTLSPNPAIQNVQVEGLTAKNTAVSVLNPEGKLMQTYVLNGENNLNISLENLNKGFYFIRIDSTEGNQVLTLVKE